MIDSLLKDLEPVVLFLFMIWSATFIYSFSHIVIANIRSIPIREISIGLGPIYKRINKFKLKLCLLPLGSFVKFHDHKTSKNLVSHSGKLLEDRSRTERILLHLTGPVFLFLCGFLLLNAFKFDLIIQTYQEILQFWLSPIQAPIELWETTSKALISTPHKELFGTTFVVLAAINIIPIIPLTGGMVLILLTEIFIAREISEKSINRLGLFGLLIYVLTLVLWGLGFILWFF